MTFERALDSARPRASWRHYYQLTKPGIIRGNIITATAGFLLAARGDISLMAAITMVSGLALVIAAACISNNVLDIELDKRMNRTSKRALVKGLIQRQPARRFAAVLLLSGSIILLVGSGYLALLLALAGYVSYVWLYGFAKRRSPASTLVGSISGAIPPLVGYAAAGGRLDITAGLLFIVLAAWQMPHFYAISMYRQAEYRSAGLPVMAVARGMRRSRLEIIIYTYIFAGASIVLGIQANLGSVYLVSMFFLSAIWAGLALAGSKLQSDSDLTRWARRMFFVSLLVITGFSLVTAFSSFM